MLTLVCSLYDKSADLRESSTVASIISICESEPADVPSPFKNRHIHSITKGKHHCGCCETTHGTTVSHLSCWLTQLLQPDTTAYGFIFDLKKAPLFVFPCAFEKLLYCSFQNVKSCTASIYSMYAFVEQNKATKTNGNKKRTVPLKANTVCSLI